VRAKIQVAILYDAWKADGPYVHISF